MNKKMKYYGAAWSIALIIFNVITFVTPSEIDGVSKYSASFWIGYSFITVAFIGQLICACIALKENNLQKLFYNISLIFVSYTGLVIMLVAGLLCMTIPQIPYWVGVIVCVIVLGITVIALIGASAAIEAVEKVDDKIKQQTFFMKTLSVKADTLVSSLNTPETKHIAEKVYDAIQYSDPMSNPTLSELEVEIERKFDAFSNAVKSNEIDLAKELLEELLLIIRNRNQKCKMLK